MDFARKSGADREELPSTQPTSRPDVSSASADLSNNGAVPVPISSGRPLPVWAQRFAMIVQVLIFIYFGLILVALPWKLTDLWLNNLFVASRPDLRAFLGNYFERGLVSGIGLDDIWIGIWTAVHYRDRK